MGVFDMMTETLITSSVLIGAVCLMRRVLRKRARPELLYALWLLPALRLMLPGLWLLGIKETADSALSIMNAAGRLETAAAETLIGDRASVVFYGQTLSPAYWDSPEIQAAAVNWREIFTKIWIFGAALFGLWLGGVNLLFFRRLRQKRRFLFWADRNCGQWERGTERPLKKAVPVYETEAVGSPCCHRLLGSGAVYLPSGMADSLEREGKRVVLNHILAHEICHIRHRDGIWGLLRCLLLCLYWINPLVWLAAVLSRRDCEMACDAAAVKLLGERQRFQYANTLLQLTQWSPRSSGLFYGTAAMEGEKKTMIERIKRLSGKYKNTRAAAVLAAVCALILAACTFTGEKEREPMASTEASTEASREETPGAEPSQEEEPKEGESIPEENYLEIVSQKQYGNFQEFIFLMREGGTGNVAAPDYLGDLFPDQNPNQDVFVTLTPLNEEGLPDESYQENTFGTYSYGWTSDGTSELLFLNFWNFCEAPSVLVTVSYENQTWNQPLDCQPISPERIAVEKEIEGMEGEKAVLVGIDQYPDALVLITEGEDLEEFHRNNVVLLKTKGTENPEEYQGPRESLTTEDSVSILYTGEGLKAEDIEAFVCGTGGERENYGVTPFP